MNPKFAFRAQIQGPKIDLAPLMAEFAAKGGSVRQFENGVSGTYDGVKNILAAHGYDLSLVRNMTCVKKIGAKGRAKAMHWSKVVSLADSLLVADGKQPFRRAA